MKREAVRLLHRVLGERLVAQDAQRESVRGAAVAVVQLGEGGLFRARGQRHERLVGEVGELPIHDDRYSPAEGSRFKRSNHFPCSSEWVRTAFTTAAGRRRKGEGQWNA
jgi:hypothetical protein